MTHSLVTMTRSHVRHYTYLYRMREITSFIVYAFCGVLCNHMFSISNKLCVCVYVREFIIHLSDITKKNGLSPKLECSMFRIRHDTVTHRIGCVCVCVRRTSRKEHCNTLQRATTHCNTLQHSNTLKYTATHCNTHQSQGALNLAHTTSLFDPHFLFRYE